MRVLDFFAGIGGFSLGLRRAGHEPVGACENRSRCDPDGPSPTLGRSNARRTHVAYGPPEGSEGAWLRILTPLECERLQGFPDGWTDVGLSDDARYRLLGNSVAVPVVEWLGRRLGECA